MPSSPTSIERIRGPDRHRDRSGTGVPPVMIQNQIPGVLNSLRYVRNHAQDARATLYFNEKLEPAVNHSLQIKRHWPLFHDLFHVGVLHDFGVDLIAMFA